MASIANMYPANSVAALALAPRVDQPRRAARLTSPSISSYGRVRTLRIVILVIPRELSESGEALGLEFRVAIWLVQSGPVFSDKDFSADRCDRR